MLFSSSLFLDQPSDYKLSRSAVIETFMEVSYSLYHFRVNNIVRVQRKQTMNDNEKIMEEESLQEEVKTEWTDQIFLNKLL